MAKNEKSEQEQEEGVDIQETEGQETAGQRLATLTHQVDFQGGNGHHQDQRYGDEDAFPAAFLMLLGPGFVVGRTLTQHQHLFAAISP